VAVSGRPFGDRSHTVAKMLYGLLFVVLLPLFLVYFSAHVEIRLSIARFPAAGTIFAGVGLLVMLWGMWDIWTRGKGLPMNAFPPEKLVTGGIYGVVPQPIYSGFVLVCLGVSLALGSATGVFLTTPLVAISAFALVLGYERPYLLRTFGELPRPAGLFATAWSTRPGSAAGPCLGDDSRVDRAARELLELSKDRLGEGDQPCGLRRARGRSRSAPGGARGRQ
jgi:protein-S-isoprenylcysteine O-methyltransferase Ste14